MKRRNNLFVVISTAISITGINAQDSIRQHYAETITSKDLRMHLNVLSSDAFMGRETATPGQKLAETYLVDFFKNEDIAPGNNGSYAQEFTVISSKPDADIVIADKKYDFLSEFYFYDKYKEDIRADEIVFVGYGIEDERYNDYEGLDVSGKVVLLLEDEPKDKKGKSLVTGSEEVSEEWSYNWRKKYSTATEKGAIAVITVVKDFTNKKRLVEGSLKGSKLFLDNGNGIDGSLNEPPRIYISDFLATEIFDNAGESLSKAIENISKGKKSNIGDLKVELTIDFIPDGDKKTSSNVLAFIEGSDKKEEVIVITAHYDHLGKNGNLIYNGADDDGSGTVALLEIAQAFKKAKEDGNGPRRSILFMPVSGEEKGLLGSEYYSLNPVYPIINTIADLNIDMIGRHDSLHDNSNYIYVIGLID